MTSIPDPFYKRILALSIFLGIAIGMWLILAALRVAEFFSFFNALSTLSAPPTLVAPSIERLVGPLQLILLGGIGLLEWKVISLHFLRRAVQQSTDKAEARFSLLGLALGTSCISFGCRDLIKLAVTLPASDIIDWVLTGGLCIFVVFGLFVDLRFIIRSIKNKRRAAVQQQQG